MKANCPHCGAPLHGSKKRTYQCGTWENAGGEEYRTVPCKIAEEAKKQATYWAQVAENADGARQLAEAAKEQAEAEARKDREFAQHWHIRLEEEKKKLQDFYLGRIREALQLTDAETSA